MAMVQASTKPLTLDEFLKLPETKPASEFIDGQIIQKPMPQGKHSTVQLDLGSAINLALKPQRGARAYTELRCTYPSGSRSSVYGGRSVVPDVTVFTWERIPRDQNGEVANTFSIPPDWTICFQQRYANEIFSPDQSQTRVVRNILHCIAHGTQMGWLIDPEEKLVFVYFADSRVAVFEADDSSEDKLHQRVPVPAFAEPFLLTVSQLFNWLEE